MTKTLTEQWREGTLPVGNYYIKLVGDVERIDFFEGLEWEMTKDFGIEEILAPVPSYDEYKELTQKVGRLELDSEAQDQVIQRLQEQLADASKTINFYDSKDFHYTLPDGTVMGKEPAHQYKLKWGVK